MADFSFDLQLFAWTQISEGNWLYSSGSSSFYLYGEFDEEEDDDGNIGPQSVTVSGSNATLEPDWTSSINVVSGNFSFVDEYDSFSASLSAGDQAVNEESMWTVSGSGYVYHSYGYFDSDISVTELEGAPRGRMTTSVATGSDGFNHITVNVNGAETGDFTSFSVYSIPCKITSSSGNNYSIIPNILRINLTSSGLTFIANDNDETEITYRTLADYYASYNSSSHVVNLISGAGYFSDSTTLDIEVTGVSAGLKVVEDSFVAYVDNNTTFSINTDDPLTFNIDGDSWVWIASDRTLYFDTNMTMTGISGVSGNTNITVTDTQIRITGAILNNAAIDDITISGTDTNPNNGYVINIIDDGLEYEFVEDSSTASPTVASVIYSSGGAFTFLDTDGNIVNYSAASVNFTTLRSALVLGENSPLDITISSAADGLAIFDVSTVNSNLVAKLNTGDVFADDHIETDANAINAWVVDDDGNVALGENEATISGISIQSTTTIVKTDTLIEINNATLSGAAYNGSAIAGSDNNPSDGYQITLVGGSASFVGGDETGALASISYNGAFSYFDSEGNSLEYVAIAGLIATGEGGLITLSNAAPNDLTISSSADELSIFNASGIAAKLNSGDAFSNNQIITDSAPTNAWTSNDGVVILGRNEVTIAGITVNATSSIVKADNLISIANATLDNASLNGNAISGSDDDPSDGYQITLGSGGSASFLGAQTNLASISYDGTFSFFDDNGNSLAYGEVTSLLATADGGSITLTALVPASVTIDSSVDDLKIFTGATFAAKLNSGDALSNSQIIIDSAPTDSWLFGGNTLILGQNEVTITGITADSTTTVVKDGDLISIENATLANASINGSAIGGEDNNPADGYQLTLGADGWEFIESTINPWTSVDGGYVYNGDDVSFTLLGAALVDEDQNERPDNVSVNISSIESAGVIVIISGLSGEVSLNGNSLGILGDTSYNVGLIGTNGNFTVDSYSRISSGATINANGKYIDTDGDGTYVFGDGTFTINDQTVTVNNNSAGLAFSISNETISAAGIVQSGGLLEGADNASVAVNGTATVNGIVYATDDPNGIVVNGASITGLDANSILTINPSGTYVVNSTTLELTSDTAVYGVNSTLAAIGNAVERRARNVFDVPDDAEFISAARVRATLDATYSDSIGGFDWRGDKIIELNERTDGVTANLDQSSGQKFVVIDGYGNQTVNFNPALKNGALIEENVDGEKLINGGNSGDVLINLSTRADVTLNGGSGDDSILAAGGHNEVINLANGGSDTINAPSGTSVRGYDPNSGAAFITPVSKASLLAAIENGTLSFGNGTFNVDNSGAVSIDGVGDSTELNLLDSSGNSTRVIFANQDNVTVGMEEASIDLLLYGDLAELTLLGGIGNDTIRAGDGNLVRGGGGNNRIVLQNADDSRGNSVELGNGDDTVEVFTPDWDTLSSDRLLINNTSTISYAFQNNDLKVSSTGGSILVTSIKSDTATKVFMSTSMENAPSRAVLIDAGSTYKVTNSDERADRYIGLGENTGVDFSEYSENQTLDLGSDGNQNIRNVTLGGGSTSLHGSSENETITAGAGRSTIASGDGNDMLIAAASDDKNAGSAFVYTAGLDTIQNYETVGNSATADEIIFNAPITTVESFGNDVVIESGTVDQLTIMDAANAPIKVNGGVFEIGTQPVYDANVLAYFGSGVSTLNVGDGGGNVWLNDALGNYYLNVGVIDASGSTADSTLVGNTNSDDVIIGGNGTNLFWGSMGGNDRFTGGTGYNEYFYLYGDGNDTIDSSSDDDVIKLLNIGADQISWDEQRVSGDSICMKFNDGGSLTVNTRLDIRVELSDGSRWSADRSNGSWYSRS